mmetsp:Transcript_27215/g.55014  ORF Transcript_27215/g.55014 Transcript_27215/m.55014 type:complete len:225 (+) Transcript_27215:166-840(+)
MEWRGGCALRIRRYILQEAEELEQGEEFGRLLDAYDLAHLTLQLLRAGLPRGAHQLVRPLELRLRHLAPEVASQRVSLGSDATTFRERARRGRGRRRHAAVLLRDRLQFLLRRRPRGAGSCAQFEVCDALLELTLRLRLAILGPGVVFELLLIVTVTFSGPPAVRCRTWRLRWLPHAAHQHRVACPLRLLQGGALRLLAGRTHCHWQLKTSRLRRCRHLLPLVF